MEYPWWADKIRAGEIPPPRGGDFSVSPPDTRGDSKINSFPVPPPPGGGGGTFQQGGIFGDLFYISVLFLVLEARRRRKFWAKQYLIGRLRRKFCKAQ